MDDLHDAMHLIGLLIPSQVKRNDEIKKTSVSLVVGAADLQKLFAKPENASLVAIFGEYLAPTLCHVAESPSNVTIKRKALSTLTSWTQLVDIETFENVARDEAPIAAVVARALIDPQGELLKEAAKLCAMTLEKSNEDNQEEEAEFIKRFAKEGGAHALEVRAKEYNFLIAEAAEKSAGSEEKRFCIQRRRESRSFKCPRIQKKKVCESARKFVINTLGREKRADRWKVSIDFARRAQTENGATLGFERRQQIGQESARRQRIFVGVCQNIRSAGDERNLGFRTLRMRRGVDFAQVPLCLRCAFFS